MKHIILFAFFLGALLTDTCACPGSPSHSSDSATAGGSDCWAYNVLHIIRQKAKSGHVVRVAVVDCGFRLSHKSLKGSIFANPGEIPGNFKDDDRNGYVDDVNGWDMSDHDNDVSVPEGRERMFYHGTHVAGIIATVFQKCFGEEATGLLKIIPIKVLSDQAGNTYFEDGYRGIKYASDLGADIICCAWSGGQISGENKAILDAAIRKGIIIIGAAGNHFTEQIDPPSSFPGVICVASLDSSFRKSKYSNFGMRVDISAPGDSVWGPHPLADNSYVSEYGTSVAAAIITGCAAILKAVDPKANLDEITDALRNTAMPLDSLNLTWCGKLGAGLPNMKKAIEYLKNPDYKYSAFDSSRPEGKIFFNKKKSKASWVIKPAGAYKGIHITTDCGEPEKLINVYAGDSLCYNGPFKGIIKPVFIPGSMFLIELQQKTGLPRELELKYNMETIDSAKLFCHDIQTLEGDHGIITDGSGNENYANNCSCKWQLSISTGRRIQLEMLNMDTQPNIDYIWVFDGTSTLQENLLAKFSGTIKPPIIISLSNNVLIWFLTDGQCTGKGWEMKYSDVE
ncbi:MAG: S8 family serine peptidase [Bacteroidales bacterium]|nr:S8 family serine peptidase [Bacteroidales bacterium]